MLLGSSLGGPNSLVHTAAMSRKLLRSPRTALALPTAACSLAHQHLTIYHVEAERPLAAIVKLPRGAMTLGVPYALSDPIPLVLGHGG